MIHLLAFFPSWLSHLHVETLWWPESGLNYAFTSTLGSTFFIGTPLITGTVLGFHHLNCGAPGCWRLSKHHYIDKDGKRHQLCHKHDIDPHPKAHWWSRRQGHSLEHIHAQIVKSRTT